MEGERHTDRAETKRARLETYSIPTAGNYQSQPTSNVHTSIICVPNNKVALFIGNGCEIINTIQSISGVHLQISPPDVNSMESSIFINGSQGQMELAQEMINEIIKEGRLKVLSISSGYMQPAYTSPASLVPPAQAPSMPYQTGYEYSTHALNFGYYDTNPQAGWVPPPQQDVGYYGQTGSAIPAYNYGYDQLQTSISSQSGNQGYLHQPSFSQNYPSHGGQQLQSSLLPPPSLTSQPPHEKSVYPEHNMLPTFIWWDLMGSHIPDGIRRVDISRKVVSFLRKKGYKGPVTFTVCADYDNLPTFTQKTLCDTGLGHMEMLTDTTAATFTEEFLIWRRGKNNAPCNILVLGELGDHSLLEALIKKKSGGDHIFISTTESLFPEWSQSLVKSWSWEDVVKNKPKKQVSLKRANEDKISVWWDIDSCSVPDDVEPTDIGGAISTFLKSHGYYGRITIFARGVLENMSPKVRRCFHICDIDFKIVPEGAKDGSNKRILTDMCLWSRNNSPPANYLLISTNADFAYALHQLMFRGYHTMLAHMPNTPDVLIAAAERTWLWKNMLRQRGNQN